MSDTAGDYRFPVGQCDVHDKDLLNRFRQKRQQWVHHLSHDEHHSMQILLSSMAWKDIAYRMLASIAEQETASGLRNPLIAEALIDGYFAVQVLAIRRLMDRSGGTISLKRLIDDIRQNRDLFTRENFVAFDGLPYDYEQSRDRVMRTQLSSGPGPHWGAREGPDAWSIALSAHEFFDKLSGIKPLERQRSDRIPNRLFDRIAKWRDEAGAESLLNWCDNYLAHASGLQRRQGIETKEVGPNVDKITAVIRSLIRASEAVAYLIRTSGHGSYVPVAQFNQFEHLNAPSSSAMTPPALRQQWDALVDEREAFLGNVLDALIA